ncbi:MAG: YebC/PmpR family DNA-binding transcriptional regulator [Bacteroidetes bacterium]|nr:YebC/PmpR family DNA-binding transcriptional regulator [Bacteroidota bacterium]
MSGHSKWSKIKRKKGAADHKRSKIFSRIIKEITVAVKEGKSGDPDMNPRLRLAITNAKGANMPKDNIDRAIKKASESGGADLMELTYEGYTPGGIAVFVECTTDNQNRTISNVRAYFNKNGGNLATNGSVDFLFDRKGVFVVPQENLDEDEFTLEVIDAGAEDVELDDDFFTITTAVGDFGNMLKKLESLDITPQSAELQRIPLSTSSVDLETAKKALRLIELIEDDEDVNMVFHNLELTDELMGELD